VGGFDHGVGHSHLLLDDTKAPHCQKSKGFKGLGPYPSNTFFDAFSNKAQLCYSYNYLIFQ